MALSGYKVLDGGLATQMIAQGYPEIDDDPLWNASFLKTNPEVIKQAHLRFLEAGADIIETASYQAAVTGFMEHLKVTEDEAKDLIRLSVKLAKEARDEFWEKCDKKGRQRPLVAAALGPFAASMYNGSEYTGTYADTHSIETMQKWHRPRLEVLLECGVDIFAIETIPCQKEAEAMTLLLKDYPGCKAWMCFTCKDGKHLSHGERLSDVVAEVIKSEQIIGVGINCTNPQYVEDLIKEMKEVKGRKEIVVYPNSGETWTQQHRWKGDVTYTELAPLVQKWLEGGATWIGGCCRIYPKDIETIRMVVSKYSETTKAPLV